MAIYHLSAKIVSRSAGRSVVAAAAYRSAEKLHDERTGLKFDYTHKVGVEYSEILAPPDAPGWIHDRERLWNAVEQSERRKDSQLAREIEIGLPVELDKNQQIALLGDFARDTFVSRGMVADIALHRDSVENPHAHILLSLRSLTAQGFGAKRRDWNARNELTAWRAQWSEITNEHMRLAGLQIRIDHRTLEAQGIDLIPGRKVGLSVERQRQPDLPGKLADRVAEQRTIAAENGRRIIEDPTLALGALKHMQPNFTRHDIGKYLQGRTDGAEQFEAAWLKVTSSPDLVPLSNSDANTARFTMREGITASKKNSQTLADIERVQQNSAERWLAKQRARKFGYQLDAGQTPSLGEEHDDSPNRHHHSRRGPEDDLEI